MALSNLRVNDKIRHCTGMWYGELYICPCLSVKFSQFYFKTITLNSDYSYYKFTRLSIYKQYNVCEAKLFIHNILIFFGTKAYFSKTRMSKILILVKLIEALKLAFMGSVLGRYILTQTDFCRNRL